jgi:uncharacterized protein YbjT (DUF2867 family)
MILVTAAFGTQGQLLIPKLLGAGAEVRALRRTLGRELPPALSEVEVVVGDAADPAVLREAMRGAETVYHVGPSCHPDEEAMGLAMVAGRQGARSRARRLQQRPSHDAVGDHPARGQAADRRGPDRLGAQLHDPAAERLHANAAATTGAGGPITYSCPGASTAGRPWSTSKT